MGKITTLKIIAPEDKKFFLKCYNDRSSLDNMENDHVLLKKHYQYVGGRLESMWFIILNNKGEKVGLFNSFIKDKKYFWGIIIHKDHRRKGYARDVIKNYLEITDRKNTDTYIKCFEDNPAKELYKQLGYVETDEYIMVRDRKFITMSRIVNKEK